MKRLILAFCNVRQLGAMLLASCLLMTVMVVYAEESAKFHRFWPDNLYAVEFPSDNVGFIAGYSGSLFKTEDGGETWSAIYMGVNELIRHLSFVDERNGWAVGHRGSILHTSDGGINWEVQKTDKGNYLRDISFADAKNGWAVGHNAAIWHTTDGGVNWSRQELTGFEGRDMPRLHGIIAKDASTAILVGEFGTVAHTEDGGKLWLVSYNKSSTTLLSIAQQSDGAVAVGLDGGIFAIAPSTEEQRQAVKDIRDAAWAKAEAKAIKKAKRRKKVYVPKKREPLPETEVDYHISKIDSGSSLHLYDATSTSSGDVVIVGVSSLLKVSKQVQAPTEENGVADVSYSVSNLKADKTVPLPFVWIGGVDVTPSGNIWATGLRGMIINGYINDMSFSIKLNIAASDTVKLVSNRWGDK